MRFALLALALVLSLFAGCVERKLTVTSDPPGALVVLNNQEVGRTPVTTDFIWYGNYEVQLRNDGYDTLKTSRKMIAPWWQWVPFDLAADVAPFRWTDDRTMHFAMTPTTNETIAPAMMMQRATQLKSQMQSSGNTRARTTQPVTRESPRESH